MLEALAALTLNNDDDHEWIIDTGASAHMTFNPGILHNIYPYIGNDPVIVGKGFIINYSYLVLVVH